MAVADWELTGPAMQGYSWYCVGFLGEQRREMDVVLLAFFIDGGFELGERIDVTLARVPMRY